MGGLIETARHPRRPRSVRGWVRPGGGKLWSVHLNDQNGLKHDQDKSFGGELRMPYNQVRVREQSGYEDDASSASTSSRTQKAEVATKHLQQSTDFLALVEKVRTFDKKMEKQFIDALRRAGDGIIAFNGN